MAVYNQTGLWGHRRTGTVHSDNFMKLEYRRFRIAMMTFALGMASVYMMNGLSIAWSDVPVDLPKASSDVLPVLINKKMVLRRDTNCGWDPRDPQARGDCTRQRLFENRDMTRYEQHRLTCDKTDLDMRTEVCPSTMKALRHLIWNHWSNRTRGYIVVSNIGDGWPDEDHYFIEQNINDKWRLVIKSKYIELFLVDEQETAVELIRPGYPIGEIKWKTATKDDEEMDGNRRGTRGLKMVDEQGYEWWL